MTSSNNVRLIAFYLPQYHPIPENDEWWGKGFTEWTNVTKAKPNFEGHYQPHLPSDLGFYDLRVPETRIEQAELAKSYGISGFCYHYYWFNGKRLLNRPLDEVLESKQADFPFCVCWANENWTRRWDGQENEILMAQNHSLEDDKNFINSLIPAFLDDRYIKINGKPLLIVYRVSLLPDPQRTIEVWRSECKKHGIEDVYLVAAQTFGIGDPRPYGFDAAVEFPPHGSASRLINHEKKITNPNFKGSVLDYGQAVQSSINRYNNDYKIFRTVMPSWDNTARRQNNSHMYDNSSPDTYQQWLSQIISRTNQTYLGEERLVFINAWNEWGEGCHLEPDRVYGHGFLKATLNALESTKLEYETYQYSIPDENSSTESRIVKDFPIVSICIPTHNGEKFIADTMESAIAQTYSSSEIIISDDGSSDETVEIIKKFIHNYPNRDIKLYLHKQYGLNENWNFCISQAKGKYIKFLFQDDILKPECIEKMVDLAEKDSEIGLVFSQRDLILDDDSKTHEDCVSLYRECASIHKHWSNLKTIQSGLELISDPVLLERFGYNMIGEPSTVLIRRQCFVDIGLFDSTLCQVTDMDMWFRIMGSYKVGFIEEVLSCFRIHLDQESVKNRFSGASTQDMIRWMKKISDDHCYTFFTPELKRLVKQRLNSSENIESSTSAKPYVPITKKIKGLLYIKKNMPSFWKYCRRFAVRLGLIF